MDAQDLKRALAKARMERKGRCPAGLRQAVVEYAARRKGDKVPRERVAAELGMSFATLSYWCTLEPHGALKPVAIATAPRETREVTVECGPLRVRGLDIGGVAELLRRLA